MEKDKAKVVNETALFDGKKLTKREVALVLLGASVAVDCITKVRYMAKVRFRGKVLAYETGMPKDIWRPVVFGVYRVVLERAGLMLENGEFDPNVLPKKYHEETTRTVEAMVQRVLQVIKARPAGEKPVKSSKASGA